MPDPTNYSVIVQELIRRSNEDARRLRAMEQRLGAIESRMNVFENNALDRAKKANLKFAEFDLAIKNLGNELAKLAGSLDKINKQVGKFARKQDLREIERMLDLISPLGQLVEKDQLEEELKTAQR